MPEQRGLIVADDLSGASDTGHQVAARGYPTTVITGDEPEPPAKSVVVVNTDSRYNEPDEAAERVASAADRYPASFAYKKVDSTLRGNLIAEIGALLEATDSALAVVAPAFPSMGRVTVGGTHLVDGTPVSRTAAGRDSDKPVADSHLPTLLEGGPFEVQHLPIDDVASGPAPVADRLRSIADQSDRAVVVCDAATETHLEAIADGTADLEESVIYVGSGGLARHIRIDAGTSKGVLGIVGSASPRTFEQLSALDEGVVVDVDGWRAVSNPEAVAEAASDRAVDIIESRSRAVITAARTPDDVEATIATAGDMGLTDIEARKRIAAVLADCAHAVHHKRGFGGLFVTGGAVATMVLDALDGTGIRLTGHRISDAVPLGRISGGVVDGVPLITKAGAFGDADAIVKSIDYLSQYDDGR